MKKILKVLYFLDGPTATEEDEAAMEVFGPKHRICQRNARLINPTDSLEDFDLVAGAVPAQYAAKAEEQGEPIEPEGPKVPVASVPQGSPIAPGGDDTAKDAGKAPEAAQGAAQDGKTPKPPEAKPDAGKAWKPNA